MHLPYCLQRLDDGRYVVLNRDYKPLGFHTRDHVDYVAYPIAVKLKGLTERVASTLAHNGSGALDKIYLYDDGSVPTASTANMSAYMERLAILAKLQITAE